jgi:hypothetical protein
MSDVILIAGFPVDGSVALKKRVEHCGLSLEIMNHSREEWNFYEEKMVPSDGKWCYYVTVSERMLPEDQFAQFWLSPTMVERSSGHPHPTYDYYSAPFSQADWHGGVTFYEKLGGLDGEARMVKIGCDFAHYWDEGHTFHYEGVLCEAKRTAEQLAKMYAFYTRCPYNGKWQPPAEMQERNGKLYSVTGLAAMDAYAAERASKEAA